MDETKFIHLSTLNYQKIALNTDQSQTAADFGIYNLTFNHNLGYVPSVRVWTEVGGRVWPINIGQFSEAQSITTNYYVTDTQVIVRIANLGTTIKVYCRVYYDDEI